MTPPAPTFIADDETALADVTQPEEPDRARPPGSTGSASILS
jgi:hypothetical protein